MAADREGQYDPAGAAQAVHTPAPAALYSPVVHAVGALAPAAQLLPAGHTSPVAEDAVLLQ